MILPRQRDQFERFPYVTLFSSVQNNTKTQRAGPVILLTLMNPCANNHLEPQYMAAATTLAEHCPSSGLKPRIFD